MKFQFKTNFTSRGIILRFLAVLTFAVGSIAVWNWRTQTEPVPSRFLVQLPNECQPCKSEQQLNDDSEKNACFIEGEHNGVELNNAILLGFQLRGNSFKNAHIINSDFSNSNLNRANFSGATVFYSNFSGTNLSRANFTRARFHASDITSANLENAIISNRAELV